MFVRRSLIALALALTYVACRDTAGPVTEPVMPGPQLSRIPAPASRIIQQSPSAPPLEAYRVSFWAVVGKASTVRVRYLAGAGESLGHPFLRFEIPKQGLETSADGTRLKRGDSVHITLTIDPVSFSVHFKPSGVSFSRSWPAALTLWYGNANPDLNADHVEDETDQTLAQQLAVWTQTRKKEPWLKLASKNNTRRQFVAAPLYHFSEYAVCW
jgi:hypothetical protein